MTPVIPFKYKRTLLTFMAILLFFMIIVNIAVVANQRRQILGELEKHWQTELDLIGMFIVESLLRHEYANIENFLVMSAKESDDIVEINGVAPNNFVLVRYKRDKPSAHTMLQEKQIRYGGKDLLSLKVVRDCTPEEDMLQTLRLQLIAGSIFVTVILGAALWLTMKRMALKPLEAEIAVRKQSEEMLERVKNELADKVQERTRELRDINENLLFEIGERRRSEEALKESEGKFKSLSEESLTGVYLIQEGIFKYVNPKLAEIFGYTVDELQDKKSPKDLTLPEDWPVVEGNIRKRIDGEIRSIHYDFRGITKNGETLYVEAYGSRIQYQGKPAVVGTLLDITERKNLEAQLLQSQKMEAVGQLAGGVAHDFNNILTAIISNGYLIKRKIGEDNPANEFVEKILALSNNAAEITRELLVFSRRQHVEVAPLDLNNVINNTRDFMRNFLREDIELKILISGEALTIMADRGQIEQILMNLATNARDAMPDGGVLTIATELIDLDDNFIKLHGFGKPVGYALLSFTDTGTGMDSETVKRIFEPFFTTKGVGKGTGLGLSIVYGIVKQNKGYINAYSEPGKGTTFRIYFPKIKETVEAGKAARYSRLAGQGETILFAEDEQAVREATRQILEEYNYRVIEAVDGKDAVEKFLRYKDEIDLLVFDVIMPKKSGQKALDEIRGIRPGIKAIFTSGYAGDMIPEKETEREGTVFISKPLMPENLLSNIREMLETG